MGGISGGSEQVHGLHQAVEAVQGHDDRRFGVAPGDDGVVGIPGNAVEDFLEPVAGI